MAASSSAVGVSSTVGRLLSIGFVSYSLMASQIELCLSVGVIFNGTMFTKRSCPLTILGVFGRFKNRIRGTLLAGLRRNHKRMLHTSLNVAELSGIFPTATPP